MDGFQTAMLRAKLSSQTPRQMQEPVTPKHGDSGDSEHKPAKIPTAENKTVEMALTKKAADEARFVAIEAKLSKLMHMVGATEIDNVMTGPRYAKGSDIKKIVCDYFGATPQEVTGPSKHAPIARVRHIAYYLCRRYTMLSLPKIGEIFNRDHTSILHGADKIAGQRRDDDALESDLSKLEDQIAALLKQRQEAVETV